MEATTTRPRVKNISVLAIGIVTLYFFIFSFTSYAHHSSRIFDTGTVLAFEGRITRVHWVNPHTYYYVEAPGPGGQPVEWQLETDAIALLLRSGWTEETLRPGDRVVVRGFPDRNPNRAHALIESIRTEDGAVLTSVPEQVEPRAAPSLAGQWVQFTTPHGAILGQVAAMPLTERGRTAVAQFDLRSDDPVADCIGYPPPFAQILLYYINDISIQTDRIVIRNEFFDSKRTIFMDGRGHPLDGPRTNEGHSIGWWDDDVLVVDTQLFADYRSTFPASGIPSGAQKHLVERYALSNDGTRLALSFVLEDAEYLAEPFSATIDWEHSPNLTMSIIECELDDARLYLRPDP